MCPQQPFSFVKKTKTAGVAQVETTDRNRIEIDTYWRKNSLSREERNGHGKKGLIQRFLFLSENDDGTDYLHRYLIFLWNTVIKTIPKLRCRH